MRKIITGVALFFFCLNITFADDPDTEELIKQLKTEVDNIFFDIGEIGGAYEYEGVSGLVYQERDQYLFVNYIQKKSLADKAGLQVGDLIFKVNDYTVSEGLFREAFQEEGVLLNLIVLRGLDFLSIKLKNQTLSLSKDLKIDIFNNSKYDGKFFTKTVVKGGLYKNTYNINFYNSKYKKVVLYYNMDTNDYITLPEFILDGELNKDLKVKEITGKEFSIEAKDLSENYQGEKNSYVGGVYIKHNNGYYYGSRIDPGYFDLRKNFLKKSIKDNLYHLHEEESIEKGHHRKDKLKKKLGLYRQKVGVVKYRKNIIRLKERLNQVIDKKIGGINSEKSYLKVRSLLIKLLELEDVLALDIKDIRSSYKSLSMRSIDGEATMNISFKLQNNFLCKEVGVYYINDIGYNVNLVRSDGIDIDEQGNYNYTITQTKEIIDFLREKMFIYCMDFYGYEMQEGISFPSIDELEGFND